MNEVCGKCGEKHACQLCVAKTMIELGGLTDPKEIATVAFVVGAAPIEDNPCDDCLAFAKTLEEKIHATAEAAFRKERAH